MQSPRIEPVLLGTKGKVREDSPYSLALSIYAEANIAQAQLSARLRADRLLVSQFLKRLSRGGEGARRYRF